MLIIKLNIFELFLAAANLLADDQLLEVNDTVLHLVLLLFHVVDLVLEVVDVPGHVGVLEDYFAHDLLVSVVVVDEFGFDVVAHFFGRIRRQLWIQDEVFKIAKSCVNFVWLAV